MKKFRVYFTDGSSQDIEGDDITSASLNAGISIYQLIFIDYWEEVMSVEEQLNHLYETSMI